MIRCGFPCARCSCGLPEGHETPHVCPCGGSFVRRDDTVLVYRLPPREEITLPYEEILAIANEVARKQPLFIEEWPKPISTFATVRKPIRFITPPKKT